ncbi:MAG: hypothetical protein F4210_08885 [Holophagales bacterium]|nr:hypothetical protein [Holophagales bacterium]MYF95610.1 hypothetical protein [Holophagales bacterium]
MDVSSVPRPIWYILAVPIAFLITVFSLHTARDRTLLVGLISPSQEPAESVTKAIEEVKSLTEKNKERIDGLAERANQAERTTQYADGSAVAEGPDGASPAEGASDETCPLDGRSYREFFLLREAEQRTLTPGAVERQEFLSAPCHTYELVVLADAHYEIYTSRDRRNTGSAADTVIELLSDEYVLLASDDDGARDRFFSRIERDLEEGRYFVLVRSFDDRRSGRYALRANPVQPPAVATRLTGDYTSGELGDPERSWYRFEVSEGACYIFETDTESDSHVDTVLRVYRERDERLRLIREDDDGKFPSLDSLVEGDFESGTYYARVTGRGFATRGRFQIRAVACEATRDYEEYE